MCHSRHHHDGEHRLEGRPRRGAWPDETRAADADRDAVVEALREHGGAGRLEAGELEERLDAALRAKTLGELRALLADLPGRSPALGPRRESGRRHGARGHVYANAWWAVPLGIWALASLGH